MKKVNFIPFCFAIILLFSVNTFAQKTYIAINGGYNFEANTTTNYSFNYNPYNSSANKVEVSLGKGFNFDGAIGYKFNKIIGAEIGVSYLKGETTTWNFSLYTSGVGIYHISRNYSSTMLRFIPTIVFSGDFKTINPYAKIGAIIGSGSYLISQTTTSDAANSSTTFQKTKYDGGLAFGVYCGLGATYKINKHVFILGEITSTNLSYAAEKSELIVSTVDGVDMLPGLSVYDKQTEYVDSYNIGNTIDPNKPSKGLKQNISFSSIGFNIGARYSF